MDSSRKKGDTPKVRPQGRICETNDPQSQLSVFCWVWRGVNGVMRCFVRRFVDTTMEVWVAPCVLNPGSFRSD